MAKRKPKTLTCPPFPELTWDEFFWTATDTLPEWSNFQDRSGAYTSAGSSGPSKGQVSLSVMTEEEEPDDPTAEQKAAYEYLKANGPAIAQAILAGIFQKYPEYRQEMSHWDPEEVDEILPPIQKPDDLKQLVGLGTVHFLPIAKQGVGYIGFELGCTWDEEHGLGVMTHKNRVIDIGGGDLAFDIWAAENDA